MESIPFPFEPYDEQKKLMGHIYDALDKGGISILESPTGTGKSLSIICSSLHWLLNYNKHKTNKNANNKKKNKNNDGREGTPDWVNEFFDKQQEIERQKKLEEKRELLRKQQLTLFDDKQSMNKRRKLNYSNKNDDPFLVKDENPNNTLTTTDWMVCKNSVLSSF